MLLFSDGIEDQLNPDQQDFGRDRIERILSENCGTPVEVIVTTMLHELDVFKSGTPNTDDQTLIAMRVL